MSEREKPTTRTGVEAIMLLAMSEHHSGDFQEARRIIEAQLAALEAAGVRLVYIGEAKAQLIDGDERASVSIFTPLRTEGADT